VEIAFNKLEQATRKGTNAGKYNLDWAFSFFGNRFCAVNWWRETRERQARAAENARTMLAFRIKE